MIFITHGGLLSSIETVYFSVPTIVVPIFFDQFLNAKRGADNGYSITVEWSYNLAQDLKRAILDIIHDTRYGVKTLNIVFLSVSTYSLMLFISLRYNTNVKQLSQIYHHRLAPLDKEVVYWVEHVVRSRGAMHLRSPALQLSWYQKMYLDFIALIVAILLTIVFTIRHVLVLTSRKKQLPKKKSS